MFCNNNDAHYSFIFFLEQYIIKMFSEVFQKLDVSAVIFECAIKRRFVLIVCALQDRNHN